MKTFGNALFSEILKLQLQHDTWNAKIDGHRGVWE